MAMLFKTQADGSILIDCSDLILLLHGREYRSGGVYPSRGPLSREPGGLPHQTSAPFSRGKRIILLTSNQELIGTLTKAMQQRERLGFMMLDSSGIVTPTALRIGNARVASVEPTAKAVENDETHWVGHDRQSAFRANQARQITIVQDL